MKPYTKEEWVNAAADKLQPYMGAQSAEYAASLYQTYVVEDGSGYTPEGAVEEDMSYWGRLKP